MISKVKFRLLILFYLVLHLLTTVTLYSQGFEIDISGPVTLGEYLEFSEDNPVYIFFLFLGQFISMIYVVIFIFRIVSAMTLAWFCKQGPLFFTIVLVFFDVLSPCFVWWYGSILNECDTICEATNTAETIFFQPLGPVTSLLTGVILVIIYSNAGNHLFRRND